MVQIARARQQTGAHSFELVAGLILIVPVLLYAIDYAVLLYAGSANNSCCQAAARAAASGPPTNYAGSTGSTPALRAAAVLTKMAQPGSLIRIQTQVRVREHIHNPIPSAPFGGPFIGDVTIKTRCDVYPPFVLPFVPANVPLYTTQTSPWTYTMPVTTSGPPVGNPSIANPTFTPPAGAFDDLDQSLPQS